MNRHENSSSRLYKSDFVFALSTKAELNVVLLYSINSILFIMVNILINFAQITMH
jgi:hypothetical protein